ncbi:ABC transporter permease subunit [Albimonas sp. CAU 1670]|uniref:ABC transporter permease n=1 Tax=Albimonas sp. CAU 1670 TaxID=3032599 RepID=UPI0023DBF468|nr:ABC transporter permease subunit [Albimonas sp. CAU 1670]MDF2235578.1 ABC transporter permease subunit [Albimonas sp. CAU 1670]
MSRAARLPRPGFGALQALLGLALLVLCVAPFAIVLAVSFGQVVEGAAWRWALTPENYVRFFAGLDWPASTSFLYLQKLWWTLAYAAAGALLAVGFAFPFAWLMTRRSRRAQTLWLVFLLSSLSLSEVFVVMGWDVLLSNRSGLPMVLRETGVTDWLKATGWFDALREIGMATPRDVRFKTSVFATVLTMSYLVFPYAVILLYPALSRLDPAMLEAARTLGARPATVIRTVVLPAARLPLMGAALLLFVYLLGAYVAVTVFADPARQTLTITIYESVRGATLNAPFGAAQAVVLLVTAGAFLLASLRLARLSEAGR